MCFKEKVSNVSNINNRIALLRKLRYTVSRKTLLSIYKAFLRPQLDHCNAIFNKTRDKNFRYPRITQYHAAPAKTVAIKGNVINGLV